MKNFMMSTRFNRESPRDFGLEYRDGKYIHMLDETEWAPCYLYDFGWGKENGFYKKPLGEFKELILLVLNDTDLEDSFGAAAIIEDLYINELKNYLLHLMSNQIEPSNKKKLNSIFRLYIDSNRTLCKGMSLDQIKKELSDWKTISAFYSS